jgi:hypothetical protein
MILRTALIYAPFKRLCGGKPRYKGKSQGKSGRGTAKAAVRIALPVIGSAK